MSRALFAMSLVSILLSGLGTSFHTHAQMRWQESGGGSNYVGFSAPASVSTNTIWTLPAADGGANQCLVTDGSGTLSWATAGGGSTSFPLLASPVGSAGAPAYSFTGTDSDNGMFSPAADTVALSTAGTERLIIDSAGNVGIGTSAPVEQFHVEGAAMVGQSFGANLRFGISDVTTLNPGTSTTAGQVRGPLNTHLVFDLRNNDAHDSIAFRYSAANDTTVDTIGMVMKGSGKVGIGTTIPASPLHIVGASGTPAAEVGSLSVAGGAGSNRLIVGVDTTSTMFSWIQSVESGTAYRNLSINPRGGNVGIGTEAPGANLEVSTFGSTTVQVTNKGGANYPKLMVRNYGTGNPEVGLRTARGTQGAPTATQQWDWLGVLSFNGHGATSDASDATGVGNAGIVAMADANFTDSSYPTRLQFNTTPSGATASVARMTILPDGNVGLGTTSPSAKLDVVGQVVSRSHNNAAGTSFNFNSGNVQYTSASCGAFTLSNMADGGSYTVAVNGTTSGTCSFTHSGLTFLWNYTGPTTGGTKSIFNMQRVGSQVFVDWSTGYE